MATRIQSSGPSPHTAGIFADMTVDGPEIGTLVVIIDRAKNLPNRKTMGKQNPYCAARLGKEAKKTDTDRRGGQTPRWDQELRFTVHDSPDYNNLKISVFSEDKRTDLIGEAWASLVDILKPGGGKADLWQSLNFKGKYAGELRVELTYYDTRPRPDKSEVEFVSDDLRGSQGSGSAGRVKRRPLPTTQAAPGSLTPDNIPGPAIPTRAKHGPRDFRTPPRANSLPPESISFPQSSAYSHGGMGGPADVHGQPPLHGSSPSGTLQHDSPSHYHTRQDSQQATFGYGEEEAYTNPQQPDFLPELPPSNRHRALASHPSMQPQQPRAMPAQAIPPHMRTQVPVPLQHSHSAPSIPMAEPESFEEESHLYTDYPEPIPDLDYQHQHISNHRRRSDMSPQWQDEPSDLTDEQYYQGEEEANIAPPPPPVHSNSAPVVPHYESSIPAARSAPTTPYGHSPSHARHQSVPNLSPLQNVERSYGQTQRTPPAGYPSRGHSMEDYTTPPNAPPQFQGNVPPPAMAPAQYGRPSAATRQLPHRLSVGDPYAASTPPRPHPLSQEVPRPRSPNPRYAHELPDNTPQMGKQSPYDRSYQGRGPAPMLPSGGTPSHPNSQPTSAPPSATKGKNSYSIQFPVRAFASSDGNPLSTSTPPQQTSSLQTPPLRKSVSPRPSPPHNPSPNNSNLTSSGAIPFSPDSFDIHNPNTASSRAQIQGNSSSPHSPYHIRPNNHDSPRDNATKGPIVGWHGQEIDPSDHLPVDSWAPEPEKKTPTKTYGLGRERDFGPRRLGEPAANATHESGQHFLSKDTVVNFRSSPSPAAAPVETPTSARARLQKKFSRSPQQPQQVVEPLREHRNFNSVPNPYDQFGHPSPQQQQQQTVSPTGYGGVYNRHGAGAAGGVSPSEAALAREISSIDIGGGSGSGRLAERRSFGSPSPVAFVPVRSHRDRKSFY